MPTPQPLILLPPSEGKQLGGEGAAWARGQSADPALDRHRRSVLNAAIAAGVTARRAPTRPAIERYSGTLYKELDWASLPRVARRRGDSQVRIVSGLLGVVAPTDPVPHYRLKMSARLDEVGRLAAWWKPRLTPFLAERVASATVWDLLPIEHSAAMDWAVCVPELRIVVRFVDERDRTVSHWNKLLKGALVRWILVERPVDASDLAGFDHPLGYRYDPSASVVEGPLVNVVLRRHP